MRIVQLSDIHVGSGLFKPELLVAAVEETNALAPDLVAVAGDLTTEGYRHEFEEVRGHLDRLACPNVVVVMATTTPGTSATATSRTSSAPASAP